MLAVRYLSVLTASMYVRGLLGARRFCSWSRYVRDLSGGVTMGYADQSGVIWNVQQERLAVIDGDYIRDSWGLEILYWVEGEAGRSEKAAMTLPALKLQGKL